MMREKLADEYRYVVRCDKEGVLAAFESMLLAEAFVETVEKLGVGGLRVDYDPVEMAYINPR